MNKKSPLLTRIGWLLLSAVVLMVVGLYNNFPIITTDTGTYIYSGMNWKVPVDRPITYGLFIRFASLGFSLWLPVLVQSILLGYLLSRLIGRYVPDITRVQNFVLVVLISLLTTASWYSSSLMPDVFAPIIGIALVLFYDKYAQPKHRIGLGVIIFLSVLMHNSHLILLLLFGAATSVLWLVKKNRQLLNRGLLVLGIAAAAWITNSWVNKNAGYGFSPSSATHIFLTGKMAENGMLQRYLNDNCSTQPYKLCAYKDSLPATAWEFVWNGDSPIAMTGGWEANRADNKAILKGIVTTPKYWLPLAYKSITATGRQLTLTGVDESLKHSWVVFDEGTPPYEEVRKNFPHELPLIPMARINLKTIDLGWMEHIHLIVFIISCLSVLLLRKETFRRRYGIAYTLIILVIVLNAFTVANFANVLARLNSRIIWLLPAMNMIVLFREYVLPKLRVKDSGTGL